MTPLRREHAVGAGISLLVLLPVYWLPRVMSSDLMSHTYNAWLTRMVEQSPVPGVVVVGQWTNVLFDVPMEYLLRMMDASAAERMALSVAVLAFFWGAWRLVRTVRGSVDAGAAAILLVLTHGWVLQQGLLNFYLALAGSFWFLSCAWRSGAKGVALGVPFLLVSVLGNPLPAAWACGIVLLGAVARRSPSGAWLLLVFAAVATRVLLELPAFRAAELRWTGDQFLYVTGVEQLITYSSWSLIPAGVLLASMVMRTVPDVRAADRSAWLARPPVITLVATMALVVVLPATFRFGDAAAEVTFVPQRISLAVAVMALAALPPSKQVLDRHVMRGIAAITFLLLFWHQRAVHREGEAVREALARLPDRSRVVGTVAYRNARIDVRHLVDRYCIGQCLSYANYEPASGQFRLRSTAPNGLVMSDFDAIRDVYFGRYVVRPEDPPLMVLATCEAGGERYCVHAARAGDMIGFPQD